MGNIYKSSVGHNNRSLEFMGGGSYRRAGCKAERVSSEENSRHRGFMSSNREAQTRRVIQGAVHLWLMLFGSVQDVPRGHVGKVVEAGSYRARLAVLRDTDFIPYARGPQALSVKD